MITADEKADNEKASSSGKDVDSTTEQKPKSIIYHMLPAAIWEAQSADVPYEGDTLATEGFIHCTSERELLIKVANNFYRETAGPFVILYLDEAAIDAEVRWEAAGMHTFPHIYGPLNLNAVIKVISFPQGADGVFQMPIEWY